MSSPKSNLSRIAIAILLVSNITLCLLSLNKKDGDEDPNAFVYRHHLKEIEMWYSSTNIGTLSNLVFGIATGKSISDPNLIFIVSPLAPCGECLNEELERVKNSCNGSQKPIIMVVPEYARRNIAAKLSECQNITIVTYNPENVREDKIMSSFNGLIYMTASNKQIISVYLSDIYAPEATEHFLKHHIQ